MLQQGGFFFLPHTKKSLEYGLLYCLLVQVHFCFLPSIPLPRHHFVIMGTVQPCFKLPNLKCCLLLEILVLHHPNFSIAISKKALRKKVELTIINLFIKAS